MMGTGFGGEKRIFPESAPIRGVDSELLLSGVLKG